MPNDFMSLADALEKEPSLRNLKKSIKDFDVITKFYEIFNDLEKIAEPVKVQKKILFLRVENSVWRSELKFKEQVIVEKVNNYLHTNVINKIKFVS
jgi:Dna[CI] antecedent, DciA